MALAKCHTRCWDSKKTRRYYPGDQDDIDPKSEIAIHFEFLEFPRQIRDEKGKIKPSRLDE